MNTYRIGIVGLGVISKYFIAAVEKNPVAKLVAVSSKSGKNKNSFLKKGITFYSDYQELVADQDVDIVIVATPNNTHAEIIQYALNNNKHVVCEKPLTPDLRSARKLVNLAKSKRKLLFTAFHRRYNRELADLINNKKIKKQIRAIYARYLENIHDHSGSSKWNFDIRQSGGGCILDNGINVIDLIRQLVGNVKLIHSHIGMRGEGNGRHDANAILTYEFAKSGTATIELDWYYEGEIKDIVIFLENGRVLRRDMLKGSDEFKGSLWHEYEQLINNVINKLEKQNFSEDFDFIRAIEAVRQAI